MISTLESKAFSRLSGREARKVSLCEISHSVGGVRLVELAFGMAGLWSSPVETSLLRAHSPNQLTKVTKVLFNFSR